MQNDPGHEMIKVSRLSKRFAGAVALDDVSFAVKRGEVVGFLGPNGAGKTTTLRILTGFLAATEGSAAVDGLDVFSDSLEVRRRIGYLPETAPLYPEMRVDDYLAFRARLKGVSRRKLAGRLAEVKELCGLRDAGRLIIGRLSRGYCQRVGLADSLVHDPEVLLLDEPTLGLDPNQNRAVRELIRTLGRRYTILLSTHGLPEAEALCQRLLILNRGRLVADDATGALLGSPPGREQAVAEICGPPDAVRRRLETLPGVVRVTCLGEGDPAPDGADWRRYRIESGAGPVTRAAVFEAVANCRWALRELRVEQDPRRLEEVFAQLTAAGTREESPS